MHVRVRPSRARAPSLRIPYDPSRTCTQAKRTTVWHLLGLDSIDQPLRLQADRAQLLGGESSGDADGGAGERAAVAGLFLYC